MKKSSSGKVGGKASGKGGKVVVQWCAVHQRPHVVVQFCPACRGGKRSAAKSKASRKNGKLGGRPVVVGEPAEG